ncbi:MAG: hypothetical protein GF353_15515 [Candidatus Lokiarchaeota archaeon]|nr:hypothetical protein [Candidatus Lokiarchaeota archaeon]
MKKITIHISINLRGLQQGKRFEVKSDDDANIVETLALVDKKDMENPDDSIFPLFDGYIRNYLQLIWNPKENKIYDDIGIMPYGPNEEGDLRKFMPIRDNIEFNLYPNSYIDIQPDSGC